MTHIQTKSVPTKANASKVLSIYLETDLYTRNQLGSNPATEQWLRSVYLEYAKIYAEEGISTALTGTYWPTSSNDDWSSSITGDIMALLNLFGQTRQDAPSGRMKVFVSQSGARQGLAWIGTFDWDYILTQDSHGNPAHAGPYSVNLGLSNSSSWNTYVLAHEIGHNIGSRHTEDCVWGSGNQAIDDCKPNDCSLSPNAQDNTIMSSCSSVATRLQTGFGVEPGNLLRDEIDTTTRDLLDGHCPIILYLADEVEGSYNYLDEVYFHPGVDSDLISVSQGCL